MMEITNERYEELIKTEMLYRMTKNALKIGVPYPHILAMLGEPPVSAIKPISTPAPTTEPDEQKKPRATVKRRIPQEQIDRITGAGRQSDDGGNMGMGKTALRIRRLTSNQTIPADTHNTTSQPA